MHLVHFTHKLIPNTNGFNSSGAIDGHIRHELNISSATHTYEILNMSQSSYTPSGGGAVVVTTLLVKVVSKQ